MMVRRFIDTNVFVYAFAPETNSQKAAVARELLTQRYDEICISTQVSGELYSVMLRKFHPAPSVGELNAVIAQLTRFHVEPIDEAAVLSAMLRQQRSQINCWDALIIETALRCGAALLYSEDLQHGQRFDSLQVINPFIAGGGTVTDPLAEDEAACDPTCR